MTGFEPSQTVAAMPIHRCYAQYVYGTCSAQGAALVRELGGIPIGYKNVNFVKEIHRFTGDGVDTVFDGIGGDNLWRSRDALRDGGRVVTYGVDGVSGTDPMSQSGRRAHWKSTEGITDPQAPESTGKPQ